MWQTKYASAVPKNLGLGLNFRPCSEGYFLVPSNKNCHLEPNFEPQFIIGLTSNRGHYLWKVIPNLLMYRSNPADLCTKTFNGI